MNFICTGGGLYHGQEVLQVVIERKTNETQIKLELDIDGKGKSKFETGVPFLNHMLDLFRSMVSLI